MVKTRSKPNFPVFSSHSFSPNHNDSQQTRLVKIRKIAEEFANLNNLTNDSFATRKPVYFR